MIKKLFLLGFAIAILFASCKKEVADDTKVITDPPMVSIYGNWKYLKDSTVIYQGTGISSTQVDTSNAGKDVLFYSNNTGDDFRTSFTYKITDDKISFAYPARTENGVKIAASSVNGKILELSVHKLYYVYYSAFDKNIYVTLTR